MSTKKVTGKFWWSFIGFGLIYPLVALAYYGYVVREYNPINNPFIFWYGIHWIVVCAIILGWLIGTRYFAPVKVEEEK